MAPNSFRFDVYCSGTGAHPDDIKVLLEEALKAKYPRADLAVYSSKYNFDSNDEPISDLEEEP